MTPDEAVAALARLVVTGTRDAEANALALRLGAGSLLLLAYHAEARVMLPAPGSPRTLPGGGDWRGFLRRCEVPGVHEALLPVRGNPMPVVACSDGAMAMLFLGGTPARGAVAAFLPALPLFAAVLHEQQCSTIARGELAAARFEMGQYASVARALDDARREVDRTMRELALQARRLDEARVRAEDAARAKDHFLAMLGHELRNPLAPMLTVLQIQELRGESLPEHAIMKRQVLHMQRLVDDLLDVARIAGGKLVLDRRVVELADVLREAQEIANPLIEHKQQRIEWHVPATGLAVFADPQRMAQMFGNLLTNASKYSDAGNRITVDACLRGQEVEVVVGDEGIGLRPEMLERVFELFEQQGVGIDRAEGGLGLGLAIVRNLVQQHDGRVHAESEGPGRGSRFVVRLPLSQADEVPAARRCEPTLPVAEAGERVLLVDDNEDALTALSQGLRMAGFTVAVATDGASALELAKAFRPGVAVLDIGLPSMDGYALATAMREALAAAGSSPRLVALTGYGQPSERQRAFDAGFDVHLVKPVDFSHLLRVITQQLEQQRNRT